MNSNGYSPSGRAEEQQAEDGHERADAAPALAAVRQRVGQQGDDKPHERREDQAHEECQPEADAPAAADDAHQDGQQAVAQQAEQYDQDTHGSKFLTCKTVVRTERQLLALTIRETKFAVLLRTAVRQAFGAPRTEQYGELCFTDRAGKQLPLGTYYRFTR